MGSSSTVQSCIVLPKSGMTSNTWFGWLINVFTILLIVPSQNVCRSPFCLLLWQAVQARTFSLLPIALLRILTIRGYLKLNFPFRTFCSPSSMSPSILRKANTTTGAVSLIQLSWEKSHECCCWKQKVKTEWTLSEAPPSPLLQAPLPQGVKSPFTQHR